MGYAPQQYPPQQNFQQYPPQQFQPLFQPQFPQQLPAAQPTLSKQLFIGNEFLIKQKKTSDDNVYLIKNENDKTIGFVDIKTMGPDGNIRVFKDKSMGKEVMVVKQQPGNSDQFQVVDTENNEVIGGLRRVYLESRIKDKWELLDKMGKKIGTIKERGGAIKGLLHNLIHFKYNISSHGNQVGEIIEKPKDTGHKFYLNLSEDKKERIDKRLATVCCIMMNIIEQEYL